MFGYNAHPKFNNEIASVDAIVYERLRNTIFCYLGAAIYLSIEIYEDWQVTHFFLQIVQSHYLKILPLRGPDVKRRSLSSSVRGSTE